MCAHRLPDGTWDIVDSLFVTLAKGDPAGALLVYNPSTGSTHALMKELWWSNGVCLSPDESYVLVGDSWLATIYK